MKKSERFDDFVKRQFRLKDWSSYIAKDGSKLLRHKIVNECQFPRTTLYQDIAIRTKLSELEVQLRSLGILKIPVAEAKTLLDEQEVLNAAAELQTCLDDLNIRIVSLICAIDEVRSQLLKYKSG